MKKLIPYRPPKHDELTFQPPAEPFLPEPGPTMSLPLSPRAIPRVPMGKMTRKKRVRLRKRYNRMRRLARIGKVRLVVRSFMHGTIMLKEQPENKRWYDLGEERHELTPAEAAKFPEAEEITCPECLYELEHGEAVPKGIVHDCDTLWKEEKR